MAGTKRTWTIGAYEDETGQVHVDQEQLIEVMSDIAGTLRAVGGMFSVAADRVEVGNDEARTVGYHAMWQAFSPMRRAEEPMPHEEPEPAPNGPVPVEA